MEPAVFDLLRVPLLGGFLKWRHSRTLLQIPLFAVSVLMILHGLLGPQLAPKNLATVLSWVHFRGVLVLALLCAGNFFCMMCPFMLVRNAARRFIRPRFNWPRALRNKWISVALFVLILFSYEYFGLWSSPWWTAWVIVIYFGVALAVDGLFKHASFCKFVCPIGQFNFVASTVSPLEVKVREVEVCNTCSTKDCIKGTRGAGPELLILQRGCELALFQPAKVGNMDCTFCLDCVHACPHDNVGILGRLPGEELTVDPVRSGIGVLSRRRDISALAVVFTFGALLNAFGMVSPVYALESWIGGALHLEHHVPILGTVFAMFLVVEPAILLVVAAQLTRRSSDVARSTLGTMVRYSYSLLPLGFGMWLAHYSFHLLTGLYTILPVTQSALQGIGWPVLGMPIWRLTGLPVYVVQPFEFGFLLLGFMGSLMVAWRLAEEDSYSRPLQTFAPWATVSSLLLLASLWMMSLPMDMRATMMSG